MLPEEVCTAARVRHWLIEQAEKIGPGFQFTTRVVNAALGADEETAKQVSAALSKMGRTGILSRVGREEITRAIVYVTKADTHEKLGNFPDRRKPRHYDRIVTRPSQSVERLDVDLPEIKFAPGFGVNFLDDMPEKVEYKIGPNADRVFNDAMEDKIFVGPGTVKLRFHNPSPTIVDDLLAIGIALEHRGPSRALGLELLRLTERVFKESK